MRRTLTLVLALSALAAPAAAQEIRSDLPLWGAGASREQVWPRHFVTEQSMGCASVLHYGDWRFREADENPNGLFSWMRISNYGVFHCAMRFAEGFRREALHGADVDLGFLVELGDAGQERLYAFQIGLHSSRYILLAATPPVEGAALTRFRVLDAECPRRLMRQGPRIDIFGSSYCVVETRRDLIGLARAAARKPSERWLERVGDFDPPEGG